MEATRGIVQNGESLGTIYLSASYDVWTHVNAYLGILALMMLLSMAVALLLAAALRRTITGPVEALAAVADAIVSRRDPSIRAPDTPLEEFSTVARAFNSVLDESQERTHALQASNEALTQQIRDRLAAESALALADARLESTMAAAEIGTWVWNLQTQEMTLDRNLSRMYGREAAASLTGDASLLHQQIHAEDLSRVRSAEQAALQSGRLESTEYRIVRPDGSVRWVVSRGMVHGDLAGKPTMLLGLLIDITAQRVAERALRQSENLYRAIGESIDYGVWVCDAAGRNIYCSDSFLRLMGITQEQCANLGWSDLLHPDDAQATIAAWKDCLRTGDFWYREHRFLGADKRYHPILAQGVPMRDEDGKVTGWAGINLDISRIKQTEDALREQDRRKDDFLATLAHELRNPLAPIRHAARLLGLKGLDEQQSQTARDIISRQVARMALLLDDLLEVSRITRGRLDLRKEWVSLSSLVKTAVETSKPLIEYKKHDFTIQLPDVSVEIEADPLRLSQALSNLLTNAAKYTDPGGRVQLEVQASEREVTFTVKDSGIGLPASVLPSIFGMFSQVDSAIDRSEGGLGIGLALVKGLVALHGGTVEAASEGLGRGSTFTIRLPGESVRRSSAVLTKSEQPARTADLLRGRILVVDDNRDAASSLAMVLRAAGHAVITGHSGEDALEIGAQEKPDAIVLDIGMPDMNGYEVAKRLRRTEWGKAVLLLAVTGWGQKEDVQRAFGAGFDFHMTKPADPDGIEHLVEQYLKLRRDSEHPQQENRHQD
jgi:PAS domain S-box-containing protein